ncbi:MAG: hypothetical protein UE295_05355 [Acutalibacteraceae bacterium]|nr:hypothetical protein [Acutalibacteraceae bacterium]
MERKEAGKLIRKLLKENGIKATYKTESSYTFDFVIWINGKDEDYERVAELVRKANLVYSDPENDVMTDYWGSHNSLVLFNGRGC